MEKELKKKSERKEKNQRLLKDAIVSLPIAILLVVFLNIYWNWRYTYGFGDEFTMTMSLGFHLGRSPEPHKEVSVINVSYDKVLVDRYDEHGHSGQKPITDRKKLNDFLTALKEHDGYRYVLLDVDFSAGLKSEYDDSLFRTIASMRDIVVATSDPASDPEMIRGKTAKAFYQVRKTGDDFLKYTFMNPETGEPSIALKMWQDMTGGTYEKSPCGYRMNGKRCYNSIIPSFRFMILDNLRQDRSVQLPNLGTDVLTAMQYVDDFVSQYDDKVIIIGDWLENDIHDTIAGPQPGSAIIYNAYLSLVNGDNIRSIWVMLLLTIILWVEVMFMLRGVFGIRSDRFVQRVNQIKSQRPKMYIVLKILSYVGVFVTYAFPLKCFELIIYAFNGTIINTLALSLVFTILSEIISELNNITVKY